MNQKIIELTKDIKNSESFIKDYDMNDLVNSNGDIPIERVFDIDGPRKDTIKDILKHKLDEFGVIYNDKRESIIFPKGFKNKYFKKRFDKLKKLMDDFSLNEFSGSSHDLFRTTEHLSRLIEDPYNMYIYTDDGDLITIDEFIRDYMIEDDLYWIGGILAYKL